MYCLYCDRWGLDHLLRDAPSALAPAPRDPKDDARKVELERQARRARREFKEVRTGRCPTAEAEAGQGQLQAAPIGGEEATRCRRMTTMTWRESGPPATRRTASSGKARRPGIAIDRSGVRRRVPVSAEWPSNSDRPTSRVVYGETSR